MSVYGYDAMSRPASIAHDLYGTTYDLTFGFAYNPASQIVSRSGSNDAYASNTAYSVVRPYSVNGLNQYTSAGPAAFAYDANGNLTSDGSTGFVYDSENRLVAASGAKPAALAYDPLGRLWQVSSGATTTRFLYDADKLVMEYNGAGALTRSYVHGPGADEPLVWYDSAWGWARRFLHADHQGSIISLNDDSGAPVAINGYDSWGIPNAGNLGRFGYTGQTWIAEVGLYYYKARFYSPTVGRFMQTDPVGYEDDVNLYAYVGNDPMNWSDTSGQGKVKWFVETVTGTYKRVSERIARSYAGRGGNVDAVGPDAERQARRMGKQVYGPVTRHSPHPSTPATGKGHHQAHVQPRVRSKNQTGHIFHRGTASVIATAMASTLQSMGDGIGTAQDNVGPDSSPLERFGAQAWDFISPASDLADGFRAAAELVRPKTEEKKEPCVYYKRCEQR